MDRQVLNIKEDVCLANGKDPAAAELLEKMKLWGEVTPFEKEVEGIRKEYQEIIDNLTRQLRAIADQELTEDEISLLNSYRLLKEANGEKYQKKIVLLESTIEEVRLASQKRAEQIAALAEKLRDMSV